MLKQRIHCSPRLRRRSLHLVSFLGLIGLVSASAFAQQPAGAAAPPVAYASVSELNKLCRK